jgi:hypothetical protein
VWALREGFVAMSVAVHGRWRHASVAVHRIVGHAVSPEQRAVALIGALAIAAALSGVSLCPFATLTGVPCPGCGLLRAGLALASGRIGESLHLHPLALLVLPVAALAIFRRSSRTPRSHLGGLLLSACLTALATAMVAVWIARLGGALGGPVAVHSIWSATGTRSPFASALGLR